VVTREFPELWAALEQVPDPEIPVLSVVDLGVVRDIRHDGSRYVVDVSPTYTGCPALDMMSDSVRQALEQFTGERVHIEHVLSPPWTTDWMSADAREKLRAYGIAPPVGKTQDKRSLFGPKPDVPCPRCASEETELQSNFGSTACKSIYFCPKCSEPFEHFKCH